MHLRNLAIIVPTKNEEKNIVTFLKSIPENIEVILIDASTDKTIALAKKIRPTIRVITQAHHNIAQARQIGAKYAKKTWLLFTDADVHFDLHYFSQLRKLPSALAYYGSKYSKSALFRRYDIIFNTGQKILHLLGIPAASGSNMIIHAKAFWGIGGFDTSLQCNEDTELFFRLAKRKVRILHVPKLQVESHDDRRLHRGVLQKWTHTFSRCTSLYWNLLDTKEKQKDWGYWKN